MALVPNMAVSRFDGHVASIGLGRPVIGAHLFARINASVAIKPVPCGLAEGTWPHWAVARLLLLA